MNSLNQALPIVAAAYGRKFGVAVLVGGDAACTDGRSIHIPALVEDPIAKTLAWGFLAHEAGHVRHTDFELWQRGQHSALTRSVMNILEDVRIEQAMLHVYPGARQTLDAVVTWMLGAGQLAAPKPDDSPATVFVNSLLVLARHRYRQQTALTQTATDAERVLRQVFPASFVHQLFGLMTEIPTLSSTSETIGLAKRIVALMEQETNEEQNPTPLEDGNQECENQAAQGSQQAETQAADAQADSDSDSDSDDSTQSSVESKHQSGDQPGNGRSALAQALAAGADELPEDLFTQVAEALGDQSRHSPTLLPTMERVAHRPDQGQEALRRVKDHSAKLSTRLQGLIQSYTQTRYCSVRQGRLLHGRRLYRAAVGDARIFQRKDQQVAPNTAIHVLVDLSGSMCGGDDRLALDAAMALALALEPIRGVSLAATAFPDRSGGEQQVTQLLAHGERVQRRAGAFLQNARGSTPMTGALWFAAADLLARPEPRKVLLTLTDGVPNDRPSAMRMIAQARRAGLELIGIGIARDVGDMFPTAVRIDQITALKQALFRIAEQLLLTTHH